MKVGGLGDRGQRTGGGGQGHSVRYSRLRRGRANLYSTYYIFNYYFNNFINLIISIISLIPVFVDRTKKIVFIRGRNVIFESSVKELYT